MSNPLPSDFDPLYPIPADEKQRLAALRQYNILDTPPEVEFDALVRLAAYLTGMPSAAITLIDEHRQWLKAKLGLDGQETPRNESFCQFTILQDEFLEIEDAARDKRFIKNPSVINPPNIRYYCGVPLTTQEGYKLGALCVVGYQPGQLTLAQKQALRVLASEVMTRLDLRRQQAELEQQRRQLWLANQEMNTLNATLKSALEEQQSLNEQLHEANQSIQRLMDIQVANREQQFRELTESITDMFFALDPEMNVLYWNRECERLTGIPASDIVGTQIYRWYPQLRGRRTEATLLEVLQSRKPVSYQHHDREKKSFYDVQVFPSRIGLSVLVRDITESKKKERELLRLNEQLTERNFELDQIVYKISHDIRSPLASVMGLVNVLRLLPLDKEVQQYIEMIDNRINKLDRFTQAMLDFSKNTRVELVAQPIDLYRFIPQVHQELEYMPGFRRLQFSTSISGGPFFSDPFRLQIIFANLLGNAIKYQDFCRTDAYLSVHAEVKAEEAVFTFLDNGIGIESQYLSRVFDMFFRASEQSQGSGLGMYIVKQTVDKLHGSISLESSPENGTQITLRIPNLAGQVKA